MSSLDRDRLDHFRQRWAEENFNGSIINPSSSSGASTGDANLTEVSAPPPIRQQKSSKGFYRPFGPSRQSPRSWRESLGIGSKSQEGLTEVAAPGRYSRNSRRAETPAGRRYTFQPRNADEDTALPTLPDVESTKGSEAAEKTAPIWVTELYTVSWLVWFSLLGVLSRLGVEAITQYPNAPVTSRVLWANLGGSFIMGFLSEDKALFQRPQPAHQKEKPQDEAAAEYSKWKKTIPLYIGLTTGYCGSFTSFSTFIRDVFLELTNALGSPSPTQPYQSIESIAARNAGFSVLALLAILIIQPAVSIVALEVGAQFAILLTPITPNINRTFVNRVLNPLIVFVSIGCWLVASLVLSIIPPYNATAWRSRAMFPLLFAPIGCLLRYYLSKHLNPLNSKFLWGTFTSNIFGTIILGMCWDLQHANRAGLGVQSATACAVLTGVQEGFCGCLTTVSTWVVELTTLEKKSAWIYGGSSVVIGVASLVIIMGSMAWTVGFGTPACG